MRRNLLVICFVILFSNLNFAQSKIRFGFLAGPNYAKYEGVRNVELNPKIAFLAGVNSEFMLREKIFLTADLYFERKTSESDVFGRDLISERDLYFIFQNDYIVLPIQVKFEFKKYDSFYLSAGFYMAYLVNSYFYDGFQSGSSSDKFEKMDYGICIGFGKTFNITPNSRINLELRESLGVQNVINNTYFNGSVNTNSLSLICGYSFDLK